ncbi:uncharacterized protein LOC131853732 [Achroia grisella]|uniref:uncharacterized protein LOC131853732 n=1 Tax=Achroia grisella TaxID=688607 RepID=UPI0027D2D27C|nr:uncharacterized protein LOC131853732 [Achroia grisella]
MKQILLCLCALTALASCAAQYYNRYENVNADVIIQNDRILLAYYKCVMDKGPCNKDGKNFKKVLPETLSTACGRCNPVQKIVVRKLLNGIRAKSEARFLDLLDKYDPKRTNRDALYDFLTTGPKMLLFIVLCVTGAVLAQEKYESIDDNFNLSEVLGNERLLSAYSRCLLNKGPCTPEIKKLKEKIPEILETRCAKCTEKQKKLGKQLIQEVRKTHPDIWKEFVHKYDPSGKYQEAFQDFLKS